MKKLQYHVLILLFLIPIFSFSQGISVNQNNSFELFVDVLKNSKDLKFQDILKKYDDYINANPDDIQVKVYKCKFIGSAYYDEYEDYNLKYEETETCINALYDAYPNHPEVIIYKLERLYGDERRTFLKSAMDAYTSNKSDWDYNTTSKLYENAAYFYSEENDFIALNYAERAVRFSDSLDLSILISNIHLRLGNKQKAEEAITSEMYRDNDTWILNQKGSILIELGKYKEALSIFDRVNKKDSTIVNNSELYEIFLKAGNYSVARNYLIKDTINEWNKMSGLQKLANHDLRYSDSEVALSSYRRLQKESYFDDFLGVKRLTLFFNYPFKSWTFIELSHVLILFLSISLMFIIPYFWVLPVYSAGKYFSKRINISENLFSINWSLKHFWKISFAYILVQFLLIIVYYYQENINFFFELATTYYEGVELESEQAISNSFLFFSIGLFLCTVLFLNRDRLKFVLRSSWSLGRMILYGILFVVGNSILLKFLGSFIELNESVSTLNDYSINSDISALVNTQGFMVSAFFVAILVPFYEEIIFRGIILSSCQKHIGFIGANIMQATLFAIVHFNFKLFLFYFIFGLITGYVAKKTQGLMTGIIFHAINNFFVLLLIYYITRLTTSLY